MTKKRYRVIKTKEDLDNVIYMRTKELKVMLDGNNKYFYIVKKSDNDTYSVYSSFNSEIEFIGVFSDVQEVKEFILALYDIAEEEKEKAITIYNDKPGKKVIKKLKPILIYVFLTITALALGQWLISLGK